MSSKVIEIGYGDVDATMDKANDNPNASVIKNRSGVSNIEAYDSKKTLSFFSLAQNFSNYIKEKDPTSLSKLDNTESWMFQRKAIIDNLMSKRLKIAMPGNFQLTSGFNVNVDAPIFGKKFKGEDNEDKSLSGKYLIVASRQIIGYEKHETIIEVATTSSDVEISVSSPEQQEDLLSY